MNNNSQTESTIPDKGNTDDIKIVIRTVTSSNSQSSNVQSSGSQSSNNQRTSWLPSRRSLRNEGKTSMLSDRVLSDRVLPNRGISNQSSNPYSYLIQEIYYPQSYIDIGYYSNQNPRYPSLFPSLFPSYPASETDNPIETNCPYGTFCPYGMFCPYMSQSNSEILNQILQWSMSDTELKRNENISLRINSRKVETKDFSESCQICLKNFSENENISTLNCKHSFHSECISEWGKYKQQCPICRSDIDTEILDGRRN